jgi:hypothetical protein
MNAMFMCKRARPDIEPAISFLSSRVNDANEGDWKKLLRVMSFLKGTIDDVLMLEADDTTALTWYIDMAFAIHGDMRSHTGTVFTMGKGALIGSSTNQKVNSRSCSTDEMLADYMTKPLGGGKFKLFQDRIMNLQGKYHRIGQQECVGQNINPSKVK